MRATTKPQLGLLPCPTARAIRFQSVVVARLYVAAACSFSFFHFFSDGAACSGAADACLTENVRCNRCWPAAGVEVAGRLPMPISSAAGVEIEYF